MEGMKELFSLNTYTCAYIRGHPMDTKYIDNLESALSFL